MKTRSIVEDVSGSLNRRYFAEVEVDNDINVRREGHSTAEAAQKVVASIRYQADAAERKFVESGVLLKTDPSSGQRLEDTARALGWRTDWSNGDVPYSWDEVLERVRYLSTDFIRSGKKP